MAHAIMASVTAEMITRTKMNRMSMLRRYEHLAAKAKFTLTRLR
jgi:hypothetical protein